MRSGHSENERFTALQLAKAFGILMVAMLWPVVPMMAAGYCLHEVHKLVIRDEWDAAWRLLVGPCVAGAGFWYRFGRSTRFERGGSNWLPKPVEAALTALLVVCLTIFVVALGMDISHP